MPNPLLQPKTESPDFRDLLRRAADSLQSYCENENGDMNDSLAMEIYKALEDDGNKTAEQDEPAQTAPALLPQDQHFIDPGTHNDVEAQIMNTMGIKDPNSKAGSLASKLAAYMNGYATAAENYLKHYGNTMKYADSYAKKHGFRPKYFREAIQTMARYATVKKQKRSGAPMTNQGYGAGTVCPKCGQPIAQGAMVDWTGGVEQHAGACPASGQQQPSSGLNLPKGFKPQPPRMAGKMDMTVVEEDGYVKVKHPRYGTVCAGVPGPDGKVHHIEFLDPKYQKNNMIRIPAVKKLQQWEWLKSQKQGSAKVASLSLDQFKQWWGQMKAKGKDALSKVEIKTVPGVGVTNGALRLDYNGQVIGYLGFPLEQFEGSAGPIRNWLEKGKENDDPFVMEQF